MKTFAFRLSQTLAIVALGTALTLTGTAAAQQRASFVAHKEFSIGGEQPNHFAQGDLNGDGITDLVISENILFTQDQQVVELMGNPDGSFQVPIALNAGSQIKGAVVIADFNKDGANDIALTQQNGVVVLLGDGKGGFGAPTTFTGTSAAAAMIAADVNGDGKLDLAIADTGNIVAVLLNNGDATFQAPLTFAVGQSPAGIAAGDFNGDSHLDLAVTDGGSSQSQHGNTVAILLGTGNGQFQAASFIPVAAGPIGVAVADLNHDSKLDIAITNSATDQVSVLAGKGDGTFQTPVTFTVVSGPKPNGGYSPNYVSVDDFNGDGNPDLVVSSRNTSTATILLGDGTGSLGKPVNFLVGTTPLQVLSGDYNRDGKRDFVTVNSIAATVSEYLGKGNGTFQVEAGFRTPTRADQLILADFNEDGILDIATANPGIDSFNGNSASVLINKKSGGVSKTTSITVGTNPLSLAAGDLNHDGHLDLVVANSGTPNFIGTGTLSIVLGNGDGSFQAPNTFEIIQPPGNFARSPNFVAMADFNGDGNLDVVACTDDALGASFLPGDGKGSFSSPTLISLQDMCQQVLATDLNNDGKADLVIRLPQTPFGQPTVFSSLGNGDGTFTQAKSLPTTEQIFGAATADLNNDGIPDVILSEPGALETLLGDGHGNFTHLGFFAVPTVATLFHPGWIPSAADFNRDGAIDVAIADEFGQVTYILPGNGDGTLGLFVPYAGGGNENAALVAGDVNGDGKADLILSGLDPRTGKGIVTKLINNTPSH
jgi:hypothetical protein